MELVVEIAQLASGFVVEIGVPASDVFVKEPATDKVLVVGNTEVVGNLVGRVDNSVVGIAEQPASHFRAIVAGNEHENQVAVD